ncbi:hypothetical protein TNCV_1316261 [Trichonephila clavipes]|nr:hypothetical protein TNCV_1316261 [Trichonephila clavipes]
MYYPGGHLEHISLMLTVIELVTGNVESRVRVQIPMMISLLKVLVHATFVEPQTLPGGLVIIGIAFQASIAAEVSACNEEGRFGWLRNLRSNSSQRCSMGFRSGLWKGESSLCKP